MKPTYVWEKGYDVGSWRLVRYELVKDSRGLDARVAHNVAHIHRRHVNKERVYVVQLYGLRGGPTATKNFVKVMPAKRWAEAVVALEEA